jgi:hypothetical protein
MVSTAVQRSCVLVLSSALLCAAFTMKAEVPTHAYGAASHEPPFVAPPSYAAAAASNADDVPDAAPVEVFTAYSPVRKRMSACPNFF